MIVRNRQYACIAEVIGYPQTKDKVWVEIVKSRDYHKPGDRVIWREEDISEQ